ncbi:MAG: hypothetical protein AB7P18_17670 [Candidatus Binatia bacterium]
MGKWIKTSGSLTPFALWLMARSPCSLYSVWGNGEAVYHCWLAQQCVWLSLLGETIAYNE